eukprot:7380982-Prymnesium_polylepis.1
MVCTGGSYPLHLACELSSEPGSILAILSHYTDAVHIADDDGDLPIHAAAGGQSSPQVIDALLTAFPASIRQMNKLGMLPLHKATKFPRGRLGKCRAPGQSVVPLVQAYSGAVRVQDTEGCIPLQYALVHSRSEGLHFDAASTGADKEAMPAQALVALISKDMPIDLAGKPVHHAHSWTTIVSQTTANAGEAVATLLAGHNAEPPGYGYGAHVVTLAETLDANERTALQLAGLGPKQAIYVHLLFCGRYELQAGPPEHRSATSVVLRALDRSDKVDLAKLFDEADGNRDGFLERAELEVVARQLFVTLEMLLGDASKVERLSKEQFLPICKKKLGDSMRPVVIKLMQNPIQWERETNMRKEHALDPHFVVQALESPSSEEVAHAVGTSMLLKQWAATHLPENIRLGESMIVMDAADRNLLQIYQQERPEINMSRALLTQVGSALRHLHEEQLMHGDVKSPNVVRSSIDGTLRLIDFDASALITTHDGRRGSSPKQSHVGAKFSSATLPPELIYQLKSEAEREALLHYWQSGSTPNDKELQAKVAPLRAPVDRMLVVKSFLVDSNGVAITKGLPYDLVEASETIDCWAFGVLAYMICTGEPLFPSTRDDDCSSGKAMADLYDWGTKRTLMRERLEKVRDPAAQDMISKLLQREPEARLSMMEALEHPFLNPRGTGADKKLEEILATQRAMQAEQQKHTMMLTAIQDLSIECKRELRHTREVLLKGIFEATEVQMPTSFVVLLEELPAPPSAAEKAEMLELCVERGGSGVTLSTGDASLSFTDEGVQASSQLLNKYKSRFEEGMRWVSRIREVGSAVMKGDSQNAFETIKAGLSDLVTAEKMFLYLVDELKDEPVRCKGYPIVITKPSDIVPKLLPVMQVGMRAMSIYNGPAGIARAFGYPVPKVPKAWRDGARKSVELLKQESSVQQFGVVHGEVTKGNHESKTVRGQSLRQLHDFLKEYDPGLKSGQAGHFAGLQRIGNPEDGTAVWTTLTDPVEVKEAIERRSRERQQELRVQDAFVEEAMQTQPASSLPEYTTA